MNEKVQRIARELAGLSPDELEEVLQSVGIKSRIRPGAKLLVPGTEYERNRSFLEAAGVGFSAGADSIGHLVLPLGTRLWSSPSVLVPNGQTFILAIMGGTEGRRVVPL